MIESFGGHDEHKSDDARGVYLERPSFERSGGGRPNKLATQRHSNATGEDAAGASLRDFVVDLDSRCHDHGSILHEIALEVLVTGKSGGSHG